MAENILARLAVEVTAKATQFGKTLNDQSRALGKFQKNVTDQDNSLKGLGKTLGGFAATVGVAFGVSQVSAFTFEVAKLAGEAEGVRAAFDRLPDSEKLMNDLKNATSGTVSELDLMKRTVQASNFGIALESLPELLKFAAIRAQQTGQSVDYLVDSIITGIGRKSPLILDNLGISAVRLKEQFGGAALEAQSIGDVAKAVGNIATEELRKMGDFSDNTSSKVQRLGAAWDNFKVTLGNVANSSGILSGALDFLTDVLGGNSNAFGSLQTGIRLLNESKLSTEQYAEALKEVERLAQLSGVSLVKLTDAATGVTKVIIDPRSKINVIDQSSATQQITSLESLKATLEELNGTFEVTDVNDKKKLQNIANEIIAVNAQIEAINKLKKAREEESQLSAFGRKQLENAQQGRTTVVETQIERTIDSSGLPQEFRPESLTELPAPDITKVQEAFAEMQRLYQETGIIATNYGEQARLANEIDANSRMAAADAAVQYGNAVGDALGSALSGQQSFASAMKRLTADLLKTFLARALGGIIASAATSGGPPPVAIALAAAGVAAISAMFAKIGGAGAGGGGASLSSRPQGSNVSRTTQFGKLEDRIIFEGTLVAKGNDLVYVMNNANSKKERTG